MVAGCHEQSGPVSRAGTRAAGSDASVESWPDVGVTFLSTHRHDVFWPVPRRCAESVRKDQKDKKDQKEMT